MISTQIGQLAGWPRLLADATRICVPAFGRRLAWRTQFRLFLLLFVVASMVIVFTLGMNPVALVKLGAILDGVLLTPLQAVCVGLGLYVVMPKLLPADAAVILRPHWVFGVGLAVACAVFACFCAFHVLS